MLGGVGFLTLSTENVQAYEFYLRGRKLFQKWTRQNIVERAKQWSEQALSLASDDDAVIYNAACALAVLGEIDRARDALELAIDAGLTGGDWVPRDPDWERLRDHRAFRL